MIEKNIAADLKYAKICDYAARAVQKLV